MSTTSLPRILALETSGRSGSVAVALGPTLLAQQALPPTSRHAIELMPAIDQLTKAQGWLPKEIDHLYLSLGPGSFTGLRIAVAIARALAQATGCRLVGVPSLEVIAQNAPLSATTVLPILDAKRGQVFAARYLRNPETGELEENAPPALVDPRQFVNEAITRATPSTQIAFLGEGVDYHRDALFPPTPVGTQLVELDRSLWPGQAATVHRLGYVRALRGQFSDPQTLLPIYIRLPEAEEVYRKKHGLPL